jgi:hypothetical protein
MWVSERERERETAWCNREENVRKEQRSLEAGWVCIFSTAETVSEGRVQVAAFPSLTKC